MKKFFFGVLCIGIFLDIFLEYFHTINAMTQDLGRHLLTGKIILQIYKVPKTNLYSYTAPNFPFINHHWLSEVIFYLIHTVLGIDGLLLMTVSVVLGAFSLLFFNSVKKAGLPFSIFVACLFIPILFERTETRPEIFSFFFVAAYTVLLYKYRETRTKFLYLLIPMQVLWTNMHIYFIIGIVLVGLFLLEELVLSWRTLFFPRFQLPQHTLSLLIVFLCEVTLTLFNPNGIRGAIYPFIVFRNYGYAIEENQNIFFLQSNYPRASIVYFEVSVIIALLVFLLVWKKTKLVDWFLLITFSILGGMAIRNMALFVFALFIPFAQNLSLLYKSFFRGKKQTLFLVLFSLPLVALLVFQMSYTLSRKTFGFGEDKGASHALDFFIAHNMKGPIYNNFDIGSYIEYRLYPKERVFVDGRPEAYPATFFSDVYIPMQQDKNIFQKINSHYNFNTIIFSYTDLTPWAHQFLTQITKNTEWKVVYVDDFIIILSRNIEKNHELIEKYGMDANNVIIDPSSERAIQSLNNLAYLFNTLGWSEQGKQVYMRMLAIDENNCVALYNLTLLYFKENNPARNIFAQKTLQLCPQYTTQK